MAEKETQETLADIEKRVENNAHITFTPRQIRIIIGAIVSAFVLSNGASGLGFWRVGKFSRADFDTSIEIRDIKINAMDLRQDEFYTQQKLVIQRLGQVDEVVLDCKGRLRDMERRQ